MTQELKSVITCDLEGRIETFNQDAGELFGYAAEDVIGKKRVSLFSPGLIVLAHVPSWLATASREGHYEGDTVFQRRDGSQFAAHIRITPTRKDGRQIGFCGVTTPLPDMPVAKAMPAIGIGPRIFSWLVITRAPFLTATLAPVSIGAAWVAFRHAGSAFPWSTFAIVMLGALLLHIAANTFNDYFDWTSGTDQANSEYFLPFTGGSRSIELGLISLSGLWRVAWSALGLAALCGLALFRIRGLPVLWFGLAGALSAIFYTAPPLRLAARRGLGELLVGANFGPLMTAGTAFALTGSLDWRDFAIGLPIGLLTSAILYINEFPDARSDELMGKNHLIVVLGKERARWGYVALVAIALAAIPFEVATGMLPRAALVTLVAVPLAVGPMRTAVRHYADRELVSASAGTIRLHVIAGLLMTAGLVIARHVSFV